MGEERETALTLAAEDRQVEVVDTRPNTSPYINTGPHAFFHFKDGLPLSIPSTLLSKYPTIFCLGEYSGFNMVIDLKDIPGDLGHVLVHYLLTGAYQCLQPKESSPNKKSAVEFATSVQVYEIAQDYELSGLETLAKGEMERLGSDLPAMEVLRLLTRADAGFWADDAWIYNFVKSHVESLVKSSPASSINGPSEEDDQVVSSADVLLKCMVDLWHEKKDVMPAGSDHSATNQHQKEPHVVISSEKAPTLNSKQELSGNQKRMSNKVEAQEEGSREGKKPKEKEKSEEQVNSGGLENAWSTATLEPTTVKNESKSSISKVEKVENGSNGTLLKDLPVRGRGSLFSKKQKQDQEIPFRNNTPQTSLFTSNISTPAFTSATSTRDSLFGGPSSISTFKSSGGTSKFTKSSNFSSKRYEMNDIPLTMEAAKAYDLLDKNGQNQQFLHICMQKKFAEFSPEELRWRHECWEESL